jgi:hypothetical protein
MCLSFQLPGSIAYCSSSEQKVKEEDRNTKKRKTE